MKTVLKRLLAVATCLAVLPACVGDEEEIVVEADEEVLHELAVGTQRVRILRSTVPGATDDEATLVLEWSGAIGTADFQRAIEERYGELTLLELHQALAPQGDTPHPDLVKAHAGQARTIGRPSLEVRRATLEAAAICPGPEGTGQPCPELPACIAIGLRDTASIAFTPGIIFSRYMCVGNATVKLATMASPASACPSTFTSRGVTALACAEDFNEGTDLGQFSTSYRTISTSGRTVLVNSPTITIGHNQLIRRTFSKASGISSHTVAAIGRRTSSTALMMLGTSRGN
jgi:hypothetical protein